MGYLTNLSCDILLFLIGMSGNLISFLHFEERIPNMIIFPYVPLVIFQIKKILEKKRAGF